MRGIIAENNAFTQQTERKSYVTINTFCLLENKSLLTNMVLLDYELILKKNQSTISDYFTI